MLNTCTHSCGMSILAGQVERCVPIRSSDVGVCPSAQESGNGTGTPRSCGKVEWGKSPCISQVYGSTQVCQVVKELDKVLSGTVVDDGLTAERGRRLEYVDGNIHNMRSATL